MPRVRTRKPPTISIAEARNAISDDVRRFVTIATNKVDRRRTRTSAVKLLRTYQFRLIDATALFDVAAKVYRAAINPEFKFHVFNLWFVALDGSVWVKNHSHTGYIDITAESVTEARRIAFEQHAQFEAGTRQYVVGQYKPRQFICANCDNVRSTSTNHNGSIHDYCPNCSWKGTWGHFSMWPNPNRPQLCLEAQ